MSYTVDPVTVVGKNLGSGVGGALGSVGGLLGGILSAFGSPGPVTPTAPSGPGSNPSNLAADNAAALQRYGIHNFYGAPPPSAGPTVDPVTVTASAPSSLPAAAGGLANAGGALVQALNSSGGLPTTPATPDAPTTDAGSDTTTKQPDDSNTVDPFTVTASPRQPTPNLSLAAVPALTQALDGASLPTTPAVPDQPEADPGKPLDLATIGGAAGLGLLAQHLAGNGADPVVNHVPDTTATPPGGGLIPDALRPYLPLIATLIPALTLNGGGGGTGGPTDALKTIADNNVGLANRLGDIANAGMSGNIGGMGMNSIRHMVDRAQAAIRQRYAAMGMSGSTAEDDDLNAAAQAGVDQQFKVGQQMAQTGLNAIAALTGQSAQIYTSLLNAATAADTRTGNILANFAAAAGNALSRIGP